MKVFVCDARQISDVRLENSNLYFSSYRQKKIADKKLVRDKRLSFAAGMVIKAALMEYGIDDKAIEFCVSEHGKPHIKDICFNVSHSGNYAVAVASETEVGIDIEECKECREAIVRRCFTDSEKKMLAVTKDKDLLFTIIWTLKESYLKATGEGITRRLSEIETNYHVKGDFGRVKEKGDFEEAYIKVCREVEDYIISICSFEQINEVEVVCITL